MQLAYKFRLSILYMFAIDRIS